MDHLTKERRNWNMFLIKAKDTKLEVMLRRNLHKAGYRYRNKCS